MRSMLCTAVVGSFTAGDSARMAMSASTRIAKAGSLSTADRCVPARPSGERPRVGTSSWLTVVRAAVKLRPSNKLPHGGALWSVVSAGPPSVVGGSGARAEEATGVVIEELTRDGAELAASGPSGNGATGGRPAARRTPGRAGGGPAAPPGPA